MNLPPPDPTPDEEPPKPEGGLPEPAAATPESVPDENEKKTEPSDHVESRPAEPKPEAPPKSEPSEEASSNAGGLNSEAIVSQVTDAAVFPLRGKGWSVMMPAVVVILLMTVVGWIPLLGSLVSMAFGCFLAAYLFRSIATSMRSGMSPPNWPGLEKPIAEILIPGLRISLAAVVSYLPAVVILFVLGEKWDEEGLSTGEVIGMALFALYFPMAALAMVGRLDWASVLPQTVIPAIKACLPDFVVIAGGVFLAEFGRELVLTTLGWIPLAGPMAASLVYLYLMLVNARLMGLMYAKHRQRIGW